MAGPYVRAACSRHLKDLKNGPKRGLRWNVAAADRVFRFIETQCKLAGGQFEGRPFILHPPQKFIVGSLFGWQKWSENHGEWLRRFRRAYIEMAKGNGKSPLAAAISLYMMVADGEARAEVYAAGARKEQAQVMFDDAVAMVDQSPSLRRRITKSGRRPVWRLSCTAGLARGSKFLPISQDKRKSGPRPSCAAVDEIHEHPNSVVIDLLERGFKWRKQPLLLMATNSGVDPNSVCGREHAYSIKIVEGALEVDHHFAYVCSLDVEEKDADGKIIRAGDDPLNDPSCWPKANPLLGITTTVEELEREALQARTMPGSENEIKRLRFCEWTDSITAWIGRATIEQVYRDFKPEVEHKNKRVGLGVDLSATLDLSALAFAVETGSVKIARDKEDGGGFATLPTFDAWVETWTPRDTLHARILRDKAPYDVWIKDGWMHAPAGSTIRLDYIAARVARIMSTYKPELLAFDRYAFKDFETELDEMGVTIATLEHPQGGKRRGKAPAAEVEKAKAQGIPPDSPDFPQGLWMPGSIRELTNLIYQRRIRLQRNPVLSSAIASAVLESDPFGNQWFTKVKATGRIDPLVSLAMAIGAVTRQTITEPDISDFLRNPVTIR